MLQDKQEKRGVDIQLSGTVLIKLYKFLGSIPSITRERGAKVCTTKRHVFKSDVPEKIYLKITKGVYLGMFKL